MKCEATHLGLTITEKQEWESLKERVRYASSVVSRTKNKETDKALDVAVKALIAFEKEHRIKERQVDIMRTVKVIKGHEKSTADVVRTNLRKINR